MPSNREQPGNGHDGLVAATPGCSKFCFVSNDTYLDGEVRLQSLIRHRNRRRPDLDRSQPFPQLGRTQAARTVRRSIGRSRVIG